MKISDLQDRESFDRLLFSRPDHFSIDYDINPYMNSTENLNNYMSDWEDTINKIKEYTDVSVVNYNNVDIRDYDISNYPDSVFIANHGLPIPGKNKFILSNMKYDVRKPETAFFSKWCDINGYDKIRLSNNSIFEGSGDGIWHPKKDILWLGYGIRSNYYAIEEIRDKISSKIIELELVSNDFYHLDVCFSPLSKSEVLIIEEAFTREGIRKIKSKFDTVYHVPKSDYNTMGGNSTRISDGIIAIDRENKSTIKILENSGYEVVTVNTEEFQKSGGSIDCLFLRSN